jgi:hypothetical protein
MVEPSVRNLRGRTQAGRSRFNGSCGGRIGRRCIRGRFIRGRFIRGRFIREGFSRLLGIYRLCRLRRGRGLRQDKGFRNGNRLLDRDRSGSGGYRGLGEGEQIPLKEIVLGRRMGRRS